MYVCIYVYGTPPRARSVMCSIMPRSIAPEYRPRVSPQSIVERLHLKARLRPRKDFKLPVPQNPEKP